MIPILKWVALAVAVLLVAAYVLLSIMAGGPKDAFQMLRYALPHMHKGNLHVGDAAPDVKLVALDGSSTFQLRQQVKGRPLVLVFGSFT
jgi:cytochrome oxidase Cu insertion factor (SCO1/SenC/PrrC family)